MGKYVLGVMKGDGIGPEIVTETVKVIKAVESVFDNLKFELIELPVGLHAYETFGSTLPEETVKQLKQCDAGILGPLTTHSYEKDNPNTVNASGSLRKRFDLYANIRPARTFPGVQTKYSDIDLVIVRENTEGMYADRNLYYGNGEFMPDPDTVLSMRVVTRKGSERISRVGLELANARKKKYASLVHKMNVLDKGCGLFVNSAKQIAETYPKVKIDDYHVDAFALHLVQRPEDFDVIITTNMFGDILSDLTAGLVGGLGLAPGLNLGDNFMLAQATHGSAPTIADQGIANPSAEILSAKMMLEWLSIRNDDETPLKAAQLIENAVDHVLAKGIKTPDLNGKASTSQFGDALVEYIIGKSVPIKGVSYS
ncbi:isocitrate/isopropylmalate dehydrogenase family protein [Salirhabdus salicampi]|uniref:isocitrate/isopropylmalate dehydrogenase family protein n=1 Tax=Salirhabdus salicampi TaxID=476102 RepID=UPI0020C1FA37|nr:isocitrate/isopropylmalate dehydrogenase family protein [Salirhabdus salicampi]MCP8616322.1 isocitrate/isopropylmalate dehydrogenase family protein [Salirhabdus salicampi]